MKKRHLELTPREKQILLSRFGTSNYPERRTYREVGEVFGLSTERVRQIETKAMRKILSKYKK
jgi:RNA polymerase primary sigma factor